MSLPRRGRGCPGSTPLAASPLAIAARLAGTLVAAVALWGGCGGGLAPDFISSPFGHPTLSLSDLSQARVAAVLNEVYTRYATYVRLRDAVPLDALLSLDCALSSGPTDSGGTTARVDAACALGGDAQGVVIVTTQDSGLAATSVTGIRFDYQGVRVGAFTVDGTEEVSETDGTRGTSVRSLDLTQEGLALAYTFRVGTLEGGVTAVDYRVSVDDHEVDVRLTDPQGPGAIGQALLAVSDGALLCELRAVPWTPGAQARATCEDGSVYGLPTR